MTRILTILFAVNVLFMARAGAYEFAFSLSASDTDPWENHLSEASDVPLFVNLWLVCAEDHGHVTAFSAMEAVVVTGLGLGGFEPLNGGLTVPYDHLLYAIACNPPVYPPFLLGRWAVTSVPESGGSVCLVSPYAEPQPSAVAVDCDTFVPITDLAGVHGFAIGSLAPCANNQGCEAPISTSPSSWGRIKALYRGSSN